MITASYLKKQNQLAGGRFFDFHALRTFGDSMRNYGVRSRKVKYTDCNNVTGFAYVLYRKKPVKHGNKLEAYFDVITFRQVLPVKIEG